MCVCFFISHLPSLLLPFVRARMSAQAIHYGEACSTCNMPAAQNVRLSEGFAKRLNAPRRCEQIAHTAPLIKAMRMRVAKKRDGGAVPHLPEGVSLYLISSARKSCEI